MLGVGSVGTVPVIRALHLTPSAEAALALAELGEAAGSPLLFVEPEGAESLIALAEQYYTFSGTPGLYPSPRTYPSARTFPSPGAAVVTPGPRLSGRTEGALTLTPLPEA